MDDFLNEIRAFRLRPRRSTLAGDGSFETSFSGDSSFSSQGANKSFEFELPRLRKVHSSAPQKRSALGVGLGRPSTRAGAGVGDETVLVDLTRMDESLERRRTSRSKPFKSNRGQAAEGNQSIDSNQSYSFDSSFQLPPGTFCQTCSPEYDI